MAERERGVYSPPPDEDYDARDSGRRGIVLLAVSVVVLLAAAAMAWSTYNLGLREGGRDAPPRIVADADPFRTEPANPGGFQAPDQDIEVYDTLSGQQRQTVERMAPPPEEPLPAALEPALAEPEPEETDVAETVPADDPIGRQIAEQAGATPGGPVNLRPAPSETPPAQPAPEPVPAAPAPQPEPAPAPVQTAQASGGSWLVQLAALRSEAEARTTWNNVSSRHAGILGGANVDIQRADLGDRGIYYRVRAAAYPDKDAADSVCNRLKAAGQDCIVVAR